MVLFEKVIKNKARGGLTKIMEHPKSARKQWWLNFFSVMGAGILAAAVMPPLCFIPILFFSFPYLLRKMNRAVTGKQAFCLGYSFGLGFYAAGLYWLSNAILFRAETFWWLVPIVAPLCAVPLSLGPGFIGWLYWRHARVRPVWQGILFFAGAWCLADMSRGILLPQVWWNPILTGFPWNPIGSGWTIPGGLGTVMLQPAAWIGVDGLTFLTVALALTPLLGFRKCAAWVTVTLLLWIGLSEIRLTHPPKEGKENPIVVMVQGNIAENLKMARTAETANAILRTYVTLTKEGVAKAKHMQGESKRSIVFAWPETAFPGYLQFYPQIQSLLMHEAAPEASLGLIGSVRVDPSDHRVRNSLFVLDHGGIVEDIYDKVHLVPFGEYQPAILPFHVVPGKGLADGKSIHTLHPKDQNGLGALICYEVVFSHKVVDEDDRPSWIINITNDAWYGNSAGPRQHLAAVRIRAIEEGLPIARAANTGISAVYDGLGHELGRLGWDKAGTVVVGLPGALPAPFFARMGRIIPAGIAFIALFLALWPLKKRPLAFSA